MSDIVDKAALLARTQKFTSNDDSVAGHAAKAFAAALDDYMNRTYGQAESFSENAFDFLNIEPGRLNEMGEEVVIKFIADAKRKGADSIIRRFAHICTSKWFEISMERLAFLGAQFANEGYKHEGALCYERAKEMILEG